MSLPGRDVRWSGGRFLMWSMVVWKIGWIFVNSIGSSLKSSSIATRVSIRQESDTYWVLSLHPIFALLSLAVTVTHYLWILLLALKWLLLIAVRDMFSGHWSYNFNSLQYVWTSQSHQVHGGSKGVVSTSACAQFGLNIRRQVDEPVEATRGHPCPWDTDPGVRPGNDAGSSSILSSVDIALSSIWSSRLYQYSDVRYFAVDAGHAIHWGPSSSSSFGRLILIWLFAVLGMFFIR